MNDESRVRGEITESASSAHENRRYERKPPKTPLINPFRVKNQTEWTQNFPPLDQAFESVSLNESSASAALSISVQAALQKHNRDVALHGIEHDGAETTTTSVHPLDENWNKYNNEDMNTSRTSGTSFQQHGYKTNETAQNRSGIIFPTDVGKPEEAIEVMTDRSISYDDFFQNASIELLKTPESCRLRSMSSPTKRTTTRAQPPTSSEVSTSFTDESEMRAMVRLAGLGSPLSKFDISGETAGEGSKLLGDTFALDRVDLSRISAADSDLIRNPNNNSLLLNQSAISACSSSDNFQLDKCLHHHKFLSSPLNTSTGTFGRSPIHLPPQYLSPQRQTLNDFDLKEEEGEPETDAVASPSSSDCTPASDWQSIQNRFAASPLPHNGSNSFLQNEGPSLPFAQTKPSDRDRSSNSKKSSSLSSISPNTSSVLSDHHLAIKNHSSNSSFDNASPSPTSVIPVDNLFSSDDPRRWRTVVPKRVFLSEPHQFPMEDDSFSCHHDLDDARSMFGNVGVQQDDGPRIAERSAQSL